MTMAATSPNGFGGALPDETSYDMAFAQEQEAARRLRDQQQAIEANKKLAWLDPFGEQDYEKCPNCELLSVLNGECQACGAPAQGAIQDYIEGKG